MPISPSPRPGAKAPRPAPAPPAPRSLWPLLALIGVLAAMAVVVCVLPASLIKRFLPPALQADDFSGSVWHGSAARLTTAGRPAGAIEWNIHPLALLRGHLVADLHWVKGGFVLDGSADVTRTRLGASNIQGGGPITDLSGLGFGAGWRGTADVRIAELTADLAGAGAPDGSDARAVLSSAVGEVTVSDVSAAQIASGASLGGYELKFNDPASAAGDDMSAALEDTGGPLQVNATIHFSPKTGSGIFSGTLKERSDIPPALRREVDSLAQLHARDDQGRLPVDLEFTL